MTKLIGISLLGKVVVCPNKIGCAMFWIPGGKNFSYGKLKDFFKLDATNYQHPAVDLKSKVTVS